MSSLPPPPAAIIVPPLAGTNGTNGAQSPGDSPRGPSPPSAAAAARQPLSIETQPSMTDLVMPGSSTSSSGGGSGTNLVAEQKGGCWGGCRVGGREARQGSRMRA